MKTASARAIIKIKSLLFVVFLVQFCLVLAACIVRLADRLLQASHHHPSWHAVERQWPLCQCQLFYCIHCTASRHEYARVAGGSFFCFCKSGQLCIVRWCIWCQQRRWWSEPQTCRSMQHHAVIMNEIHGPGPITIVVCLKCFCFVLMPIQCWHTSALNQSSV